MGQWVGSRSNLGLKRVDSDPDLNSDPKVMDLDPTQIYRVQK